MAKKSRLFPLHLTPFEHYMLWDDTAQHPMTFLLRLEFSGEICEERFNEATEFALRRHPLLTAIVQPAKRNRDCWVPAEAPLPQVDWGDLDQRIDLPHGEPMDLRREPGLRLWVRRDESRAVLIAQFHHCSCDGIGSYQFLGDLLWHYARNCGGEVPDEPAPLEPTNLRLRGRACYDPEQFRGSNGRFQFDWKEFRRLALRRISPLRPPRRRTGDDVTGHPFPGIRSHEFDKAAYKEIRLAAQRRSLTPNDMLLERLMVAMHQWNRQHGASAGGTYCVMVPLDLREQDTPPIPAANIVTYSLVRRHAREVRAVDQLADGLRQQMTQLKYERHRSAFANTVAAMDWLPLWGRNALFRSRCLTTAILSNTGDPTRRFLTPLPLESKKVRCGNLLLEDFIGVPPMRTKSRVTVSAFTYRRILKICMRCDPHLFNEEDTQQLLDMYVAAIVNV